MQSFREEQDGVGDIAVFTRLPSASATALRVLALAARPTLSSAELERAIQGDPAMTLVLLQAAGRCRRRDRPISAMAAIDRLGIAKAVRTCLSFRLTDRCATGGVDYIRLWRHSILTSAYAGAIARRLRRSDWACLQTAAVLCNLGVMVKGRTLERTGLTNTGLASWLAARCISVEICDLVRRSQRQTDDLTDVDEATGCMVLAASMADVWLYTDWQANRMRTQALAQNLFGAIPDLCAWVFGVLGPQAKELESILHINYPSRRKIIELYRLAKCARSSCSTANPATGVAG